MTEIMIENDIESHNSDLKPSGETGEKSLNHLNELHTWVISKNETENIQNKVPDKFIFDKTGITCLRYRDENGIQKPVKFPKNRKVIFAQYIEIKQYPIPKSIPVFDQDSLDRDIRQKLKHIKYGDVDYSLIRSKILLTRGTRGNPDINLLKEVHANLRIVMLKGGEVHIVYNNGTNQLSILLVDYGETHQFESWTPLRKIAKTVKNQKTSINEFPSFEGIKVKDSKKLLQNIIKFRENGKIVFTKHILNHVSSQFVEEHHAQQLMSRLSQLLRIDENEVEQISLESLSSIPDINGDGGYLFTQNQQIYRAQHGSEITITGTESQFHQYIKNFINYHPFESSKNRHQNPYNRVIWIGRTKPEGYTEINLKAMHYDLLGFLQDNPRTVWLPFLQLMEHCYRFSNFASYFLEFWESFSAEITDEFKPHISFEKLYDQLMGVTSGESYFAIDDYKRIPIQLVLSNFLMREIFYNRDEIIEPIVKVPRRLFIDTNKYKFSDILVSMAFLSLRLDEMADPVDCVVYSHLPIARKVLKDEIKRHVKLISPDVTSVYMVKDPSDKLYDNMTKIILNPTPITLRYLDRLGDKSSLLVKQIVIPPGSSPIRINVPTYFGSNRRFEIHPLDVQDYSNYEEYSQIHQMISQHEKQLIAKQREEETKKRQLKVVDETTASQTFMKSELSQSLTHEIKDQKSKITKDDKPDTQNQVSTSEFQEGLRFSEINVQTKKTTSIEEKLFESFKTWAGIDTYVSAIDNGKVKMSSSEYTLDAIDNFQKIFHVLQAVQSGWGRIERKKLISELYEVPDIMVKNGLLDKIKISELPDQDTFIFTDKGKELLYKTKEIIESACAPVGDYVDKWLHENSKILKAAEEYGDNSYAKTLLSLPKLIAYKYIQQKRDIHPLLLAMVHISRKIYIDEANNFNKYFFAKYYAQLISLQKRVYIRKVKEKVSLDNLPTVKLDKLEFNENKTKIDYRIDDMDSEESSNEDIYFMKPIKVGIKPLNNSTTKNEPNSNENQAEEQDKYDWGIFEEVEDIKTRSKNTKTKRKVKKRSKQQSTQKKKDIRIEAESSQFEVSASSTDINYLGYRIGEYAIFPRDEVLVSKETENYSPRNHVLDFSISNLELDGRIFNLLSQHGLSTLKHIRDYEENFTHIKGIGVKRNQKLLEIQQVLKNLDHVSLEVIAKILTNEGRKNWLAIGGTLSKDYIDDKCVRFLTEEEVETIKKEILKVEEPLKKVKIFIVALMKLLYVEEEYNEREINEQGLDNLLSQLHEFQIANHPLQFDESKLQLIPLGFLWVHKLQQAFENAETGDKTDILKKASKLTSGVLSKLVIRIY